MRETTCTKEWLFVHCGDACSLGGSEVAQQFHHCIMQEGHSESIYRIPAGVAYRNANDISDEDRFHYGQIHRCACGSSCS